MKIIRLKKMGSFLSGRSIAIELMNQEFGPTNEAMNEKVTLDFSGIENISQSFLSELLYSLKEVNVNLYEMSYLNLNNENIQDRISREIDRINNIFVKSASM